jgi:hypothetical protein
MNFQNKIELLIIELKLFQIITWKNLFPTHGHRNNNHRSNK